MNSRRTTAQRLDEYIGNAGFPPQCNEIPLFEEFSNDDQAPVSPPPLANGYISGAFLQMSQAIAFHSQSITTNVTTLKWLC